MRRLTVLVAAVALVAVLPARAAAPQTVATSNFQFVPATLTVDRGDRVTWAFGGPDTNHSITSEAGQVETFDSDPARNPTWADHPIGTSYGRVFDVAGTIKYFCKVHAGMRGTIVVRDPSAPAPGAAPADTSAPRVRALRLTVRRAGPARLTLRLGEAAKLRVTLTGGGRTTVLKKRATAGRVSLLLRRAAPRGRYRVKVVAVDAAGNRSATTRASATAR